MANGQLIIEARAPAPSPPLVVAIALCALGLIGPYLFAQAGPGNNLLRVAALALPIAGLITLYAAVDSLVRARRQPGVHRRAVIDDDGVAFLVPPLTNALWSDIAAAHITKSSLTLYVNRGSARHARYVMRFRGLQTSPQSVQAKIDAALAVHMSPGPSPR